MKKIFMAFGILLVSLFFVGCGTSRLSEKYDEEKVENTVTTIIEQYKNGDVTLLGEAFIIEPKENAKKMLEIKSQIEELYGDFQEMGKITTLEKDGLAITLTDVKHEKGIANYQIVFNER